MRKKIKEKTQNNSDAVQGTTAFHSLLAFLRYNIIGRFISIVLLIILILTLNTLFATNDLEKFALITGIELVIIMVAGWTWFLIKRSSKHDSDSELEQDNNLS
ncbi:MAG: hypothetical protein GX217_07980 [Clostridiaceae bacterium]|nr:hypothetical protein [Clostridiaceae bacterium]